MTLSAIAREFECTPSAISYIIKKAEAAGDQGGDQSGSQGDVPQEDVTAGGDAEAAAPAAETASEPPAAEPAPAAEAPAEPRRAAGRATRGTLTRAPRSEAAPTADAPAPSAETPAPAPVPAPTETLRLNRPDPNPAPVPAPAPAAPAASPATATADAAAPRVAGQPTPPVDAVEGRLRDTAKACISAYRGWRQQPSEATIQALSDTVHELRKALARVEIDMSASRREEQAIRPIPIPAHRASRRPN
ncbi:hypothetical protein VY88_26720 [Azospirillum thiophilum]|uniref:Uncharacterized protein n=1 Tax=Azospirillum thiophilum TaxID=528244 RepID=A0AAC8W506_9PROT|nr:hypothetical protein AL072_29625 [Azospirillum thiophilum]KJR62511.1 hypothetical protein VY88_26720 [Azospirillum thiophilum]